MIRDSTDIRGCISLSDTDEQNLDLLGLRQYLIPVLYFPMNPRCYTKKTQSLSARINFRIDKEEILKVGLESKVPAVTCFDSHIQKDNRLIFQFKNVILKQTSLKIKKYTDNKSPETNT